MRKNREIRSLPVISQIHFMTTIIRLTTVSLKPLEAWYRIVTECFQQEDSAAAAKHFTMRVGIETA